MDFKAIADQAVQDMNSGSQPQPTSEAPSSAPENTSQSNQSATTGSPQPTAQQLQDLSKLEKFLIEGKEYNYKDLKSERMRFSDYTKKTQEISQERKYYANLNSDLRQVKSNPALAEEFKRVYPEQFHAYLDVIIEQAQKEQPTNQQSSDDYDQSGYDQKKIEQMVQRMVEQRTAPIQNHFKEQETKAVEAQIDAIFKTNSAKYQFADEETVLARAQALHNQGIPLNDETWERIFKSVQDSNQKRYETYHTQKISEQKKANTKARDVASGGGIPGEAPQKVKLKDVGRQMMDDIKNGRIKF